MPTLILSPRHTPNSQKLWRAAVSLGWGVERLPSFKVPDGFNPPDPVVYGEPLFITAVCETLGLEMDTPADDFLVRIGDGYTHRRIELLPASEARKISLPTFFKPPTYKIFAAGVYET